MGQPNLNPLQQAVVNGINAAGQQLPKSCLICGRAAQTIGAWIPDDAQSKIVVSQGKLSVIVYAVCPPCQAKRNVSDLITQTIFTSQHGKQMEINIRFDRSALT